MKAASTEPDLTFQWPAERGFSFVLFVCVAGSLLAHAATFFLFHVVYPQRVTIPQPSPHVSLLAPSSAENIALLRWIEAEDPARIAIGNSAMPPSQAEVRYRPSFATPRTIPLGAPAETPDNVSFPSAVDTLTLYQSSQRTDDQKRPHPRSPALIRFADSLASRPLAQNPPLDVSVRSATEINPSTLLIGVDQYGEIRYHFLQQSSGVPAFDDLAGAHLQHLKFAPAAAEMTWAHATFTWGGEAYSETAGTTSNLPAIE